MAGTEPVPGMPASVKSAAESCTYNTTQAALDDASGAHLFLALAGGTANGSVVWALEAPGTAPSCKVQSLAFTVLDQGTLQTDGSITYGGHTYRLKATRHTDGVLWAEAFQV